MAKYEKLFLKKIRLRFDTENCLIRYKSMKGGRAFDKTKEVPLRLLNTEGGLLFFFAPTQRSHAE